MVQEEKQEEKERWVSGTEATAILRKNSKRDNIPDSYIRSLARDGHVAVKALDKRTNLYRYSDIKTRVVERRDKGKGDTEAARKAGSRRKHPVAADVANEQKGDTADTTE